MKKVISVSFACFILLCACNKDEEEPEKVFDVPMEDVNSLWKLEPNKYIGLSLDRVVVTAPDDDKIYDSHYLLFKKDGTGCVYSSLAGDYTYLESQVKQFTYTTEDCCHFNIMVDNRQERWTLAKENYLFHEHIFYSDTTIHGTKRYDVYFANEIRSDSVIYHSNPELRGRDIKVPTQRVWSSKELEGKYFGYNSGVDYLYDFKSNDRFDETLSSFTEGTISNRKGTFSIEKGEVDSLVLAYSDGTKTSTPIVFIRENSFILYIHEGRMGSIFIKK